MDQLSLRRYEGVLSSIALVTTWSSGFIGAELGVRAGSTPLTLLSWRMLVLAMALIALVLLTRTPWPSITSWRRQSIIATFSQAGYLYFIFAGVHDGVHGGTASLIASLQPLLVATVAGRLLGEHPSRRTWIGMGLGFVGVATVVSGEIGAGVAALSAYALPLFGMLSLTTGTVLTRRLHPTETLLQSIMIQAITTAVIMNVAAAIFGQSAPTPNADFWRAVAWMVLLPSLGGYVMYMFVTRTLGATVVSTLLYLTPPTTMAWVWLMFGEPITATGIVGLVISAIGVRTVLNARSGS